MERLRAFNEEFETYDELNEIVVKLNTSLNNEICQSTNKKPIELFEKEKEYLIPVNVEQFNYKTGRMVRKVENDSMILHHGIKYSVPTQYIGQLVEVEVTNDDQIQAYYKGKLIASHQKSTD